MVFRITDVKNRIVGTIALDPDVIDQIEILKPKIELGYEWKVTDGKLQGFMILFEPAKEKDADTVQKT